MPVDYNDTIRLSYLLAVANAQAEEEAEVVKYRDFYNSEQGLMLTDRQEEYITTEPESLGNICKRVVSVPKDRLAIDENGIIAAGTDGGEYAKEATNWWTANRLGAVQKEIYTASLRDGCSALIIDWDDAARMPTFTPNLVYDGVSGQIRFHYDSDNNLLFASKRWTIINPIRPGETGKRRLTIYRPGVIERYEASDATAGGWRFLNSDELGGQPNPQFWTDNGLSSGRPLRIPVIPFENTEGSELEDVLVLQELLNHSLSTFDIAVDYHGFPMLWFAGAQFERDSNGEIVFPDFRPGTAINLGENGRAGRIEPADLAKLFDAGVISWLQVLCFIKDWPQHVLDRTVTPPSGLALQIMEGSLIHQVEDKQFNFGANWQDAFDAARQLCQAKLKVSLPGELIFRWKSAKTADEMADTEAMAKRFEAGKFPTITRWREMGKTDKQIAQMLADAANEDQFGVIGRNTQIGQ